MKEMPPSPNKKYVIVFLDYFGDFNAKRIFNNSLVFTRWLLKTFQNAFPIVDPRKQLTFVYEISF